jgi:hypothetical protein
MVMIDTVSTAQQQNEQPKYSSEQHEDSVVSSKGNSRGSLRIFTVTPFRQREPSPIKDLAPPNRCQTFHSCSLPHRLCCGFRLADSRILHFNCLMVMIYSYLSSLASAYLPIHPRLLSPISHGSRLHSVCTSVDVPWPLCSVSLLALNHLPRILLCFSWTHPLALYCIVHTACPARKPA